MSHGISNYDQTNGESNNGLRAVDGLPFVHFLTHMMHVLVVIVWLNEHIRRRYCVLRCWIIKSMHRYHVINQSGLTKQELAMLFNHWHIAVAFLLINISDDLNIFSFYRPGGFSVIAPTMHCAIILYGRK